MILNRPDRQCIDVLECEQRVWNYGIIRTILQTGIYLRWTFLQRFANVRNLKNYDRKKISIVVINFRTKFSSRFPGIFANIFRCKIIPVYSI